MRLAFATGFCLPAILSCALGATIPAEIEKRQVNKATNTNTADPTCIHGPKTRACWKDGFSIATDFDQKFPTGGNTVTYDWEITNGTCDPDGNGPRVCFLVNDQYPGPILRATWGDTVVVNVKNSMQNNGTGLHWHGVRQYHSSGDDGVGGITECPLAPGDSKTYSFHVTQFGTSWYHSHYSSQYGDGLIGPIVFDGPATANYDVDLGPYMVNDWYYRTAYQINSLASIDLQSQRPPPAADNVLINGTNKNAKGGGAYNQVTVTKGKRYRLRLINASVDNYIRVSLDSHVMQVMTSDFIPIKPFYAQSLLLAIGQRYDVVVNANRTAGNYWFRATTASDCLSANNFRGLAIWTYTGVTPATPSSSAYSSRSNCLEPTNLAPYWYQPVPSGSFTSALQTLDVNLTRTIVVPNANPIVVWALNATSINIDWEKPTLAYLMEGNTSYPSDLHVLPTVHEGGWNYWLIQQITGLPPIDHPMHLHGHDFFVLGQGNGAFDASSATLNWDSPPRRDTATVYGGGWLALAFNSNNPGVWLMHCHIAWHISEGLGVQFVEAPSEIVLPDQGAFDNICRNYEKYVKTAVYQKDDSGL